MRRRSHFPKLGPRPDAPEAQSASLPSGGPRARSEEQPTLQGELEIGVAIATLPIATLPIATPPIATPPIAKVAIDGVVAATIDVAVTDVTDASDARLAVTIGEELLDEVAGMSADETATRATPGAESLERDPKVATELAAARPIGEPPAPTPSIGFDTLELELPPPAQPTPEEVLYIAARDATRRGSLSEARRAYTALLARDPQHLRARNNLALLLAEQGDIEGSLRTFQAILERDPDNPELLANRASVLSNAHRFDAAEADLKRAMRLAPDHVETLVQFAVVRSRRGRWREAIEPLRRALALDPAHAAAWYHLGEATNHAELHGESVDAFRHALALAPTMWRAYKGLGNVLDRLGRADEAAAAHRAARDVQADARGLRA